MNENNKSINRLPETRKKGFFYTLCSITLLFSTPYLLGMEIPEWLILTLFALFVIITGIPHGAVDHIVAASVYGLQNNLYDKFKFYSIYLFIMMVLGIVWIYSPLTGFIAFIIISIYHFGQGDLSYLISEMKPLKRSLIYISRGMFLVALPILLHSEITIPIIEEAIQKEISQSFFLLEYATILSIVFLGLHFISLIYIALHTNISIHKEFLLTGLLALLFWTVHPLLSFGIYFGLWHSFNHFFELRDHLKSNDQKYSTASLYLKTVPFTLISFLGLGLLWFIQDAFGLENQMISLLFILISVLTLPHMILIDRMYQKSKT